MPGAAPQAGRASAPGSPTISSINPSWSLNEITWWVGPLPDAVTHQPLDPESERAGQHGEGCDGDLSGPVTPGSGAGPGEEGHDASRSAHLIAVVEMVCLRIVEIHGALDEPEAEQPHVEVEVALGVARDRGDVMDAEHAGHGQYSANASSG